MQVLSDMQILKNVRNPLNGILANNPIHDLLSHSDMRLLETFGDRNLAEIKDQLMAAPLGRIFDNGLMKQKLLNGGILPMPAEFTEVRDHFVSKAVDVTSIPRNAFENFINVIETLSASMPMKSMLKPEMRTFMTQKRVLDLFANMEEQKLAMFRGTLGDIRRAMGSEGLFMGKLNLGLFEDIELDLIQNVFREGPIARLAKPARLYFGDIFPVIGEVSQTDAYLTGLGKDVGGVLGIVDLPIDIIARILSLKMELVTDVADMAGGVVVSVADMGADVLRFATDMVADLAELIVVLPKIGVEVLFELLMVVSAVAEGLIDMKLAVLDVIVTLPMELIQVILEIPSTIFSNMGFAQRDVFGGFWMELQRMLNMYTSYSDLLQVGPSIFPLDYFADMSRDLVVRAGSAVGKAACVGDMCLID